MTIKGKNSKARRNQRRVEATERRIVYNDLSNTKKLASIKKRSGSSKKETARILKPIQLKDK